MTWSSQRALYNQDLHGWSLCRLSGQPITAWSSLWWSFSLYPAWTGPCFSSCPLYPTMPHCESFAASPRWLLYRHQELMLGAPEVTSSPGWTRLSPTDSPHWASAPVLTMLVASTELTSVCQCLSCTGRAQTWTQYSRSSLIEYHYLHIYKARNLYCILHQPPNTFKDFKVLLSC